ncbi:MFS transporter [Rhodococcus qingshengii]|uniref:MFS transporter n=1 Tax=Rhodococcus qingshengii TaxID=334542 RepID=UPI0002B7D584|nr:MFS transporter [Rhodococcus qingshengii]EME20223.1 MFS transporter [Rhodococcus qingshengii BKS 20-40]MDJ0487585.1 MFS transporter [Rhodococcus qingshengii]
MTNTIEAVDGQVADPRKVRKVVAAGCVGIFVELYDNGVFAFMATALAIVFFDVSKSSDALMLVFAGYAVSFFVRPLGAVVCGILGDRIGRQKMLVFVIMLISVATAGIGLLPTYAAIGIAAPALLIFLRIVQGFSVGGEAAGAMTFLAEHAPEGKRGLITSYAQIASFLALLTGTMIAFAMSPWLNADAINGGGLASWAWRIPFLMAIPMGIIGWYIRRAISDTPNFERLKESGGLSRNPLKEAFSTPEHRRAMILALFIPLMNGSGYYVLFSYMPTFLKGDQIGFSTGTALLVTASSLVAICFAIPFMGALSDRIGRKKVIAGAAAAMVIGAIPCYAMIVTGNVGLAVLGACLMAVIFAGHTAVIHILIVELFPTRVRYSAYGLGYNISSALFGGTAPLLMTWLIPEFGIYVPAFYAVITAVGTLIAVSTITDRAHVPLRDTL